MAAGADLFGRNGYTGTGLKQIVAVAAVNDMPAVILSILAARLLCGAVRDRMVRSLISSASRNASTFFEVIRRSTGSARSARTLSGSAVGLAGDPGHGPGPLRALGGERVVGTPLADVDQARVDEFQPVEEAQHLLARA